MKFIWDMEDSVLSVKATIETKSSLTASDDSMEEQSKDSRSQVLVPIAGTSIAVMLAGLFIFLYRKKKQ